jgi:hypothetical protein
VLEIEIWWKRMREMKKMQKIEKMEKMLKDGTDKGEERDQNQRRNNVYGKKKKINKDNTINNCSITNIINNCLITKNIDIPKNNN